METIYGRYTLEIAPGTFPLSTDSIALADFARLPKEANVLDLGSGCGTLGIFLCAKDPGCTVTGVELDATAHDMALKNRDRNQLDGRLNSICGDLTQVPLYVEAGSFSVCISNPPYFIAGPESKTTPLARHEHGCTLRTLFLSAAWALKYGGDLYLVHKPERLAEIFFHASEVKLEPKRLLLLRHRADGPVSLVLVQCRKGAKPGLQWEEAALYEANGQPTDYYRQLYRL